MLAYVGVHFGTGRMNVLQRAVDALVFAVHIVLSFDLHVVLLRY